MQSIIEAISSKEGIINLTPFAITTLIAILGFIFKSKVKIHWSIFHEEIYLLKDNEGKDFSVNTLQFTIANPSRTIAEDVEFALNYPPQNMMLYPHIPYETHKNPDNRLIVKIDKLNPHEFVNISLLNVRNELPSITSVRFKGGSGRQIMMAPQRIYSRPAQFLIGVIALASVFSLLYLISQILLRILI